jgi:hypothetical protein
VLRCTNEECDSRNGEANPLFNITTTVDEHGELTERLDKVPPEYFECNHCGAKAEVKREPARQG